MKRKLTPFDREIMSKTAEGRAYLEYNDKVGGEPIGLTVPFGYPPGVDEAGGVVAVYRKCIELGVTWEKFLKYKPPSDAIF